MTDIIAGLPRKEYMRQWYEKNREKHKKQRMLHYWKNRKKLLEDMRKWGKKTGYYKKRHRKLSENSEYREKKSKRAYQYKLDHPNKTKIWRIRYQKKQRIELRNSYVKTQIQKITKLKFKDITPKIIKIKRQQLLMHREIRKAKEMLNGAY